MTVNGIDCAKIPTILGVNEEKTMYIPSFRFPVTNSSYSITSAINTSFKYEPPAGNALAIEKAIRSHIDPSSQIKKRLKVIILTIE